MSNNYNRQLEEKKHPENKTERALTASAVGTAMPPGPVCSLRTQFVVLSSGRDTRRALAVDTQGSSDAWGCRSHTGPGFHRFTELQLPVCLWAGLTPQDVLR